MAIENSITFGGVNSADFGIYISGEGVFNAPQRDVEMIEIPGRNGEFALDNGRFKNIEVSYPAFNFEPDDYDSFVQNLSDFRNAICAQRGYQRLTDTFHPDEYRMATYIGGLEIKPIKYNTASEFNIVFNCKPQRWLTSGETKQTIANSGDTLTNPTMFESSPLLEVYGHGDITFNNKTISLDSAELGLITIADATTVSVDSRDLLIPYSVSPSLYIAGDTITFGACSATLSIKAGTNVTKIDNVRIQSVPSGVTAIPRKVNDKEWAIDIQVPSSTYSAGTQSYNSYSIDYYVDWDGIVSGSPDYAIVYTCYSVEGWGWHTGTNEVFLRGDRQSQTAYFIKQWSVANVGAVSLMSTVPVDGDPTYIDCDMGEAYLVNDGEMVSLNSYIDLGSSLPTLASGQNTITFDNTVTQLDITPRWWKV